MAPPRAAGDLRQTRVRSKHDSVCHQRRDLLVYVTEIRKDLSRMLARSGPVGDPLPTLHFSSDRSDATLGEPLLGRGGSPQLLGAKLEPAGHEQDLGGIVRRQ